MFDSQDDVFSQAIGQFIGSGHMRPIRFLDKFVYQGISAAPALILDAAKNAAFDLARQGWTHSHSFVVLPSRNAPRWLLPLGNPYCTLAGAQIYAPYARMARMMKGLFIRMIGMGWNGWAGHRLLVACREPLPIEALVSEVTGERHPIFALSLGNQAAVRKLTIQVMRPDGEILGYIKLALTGAATERVRREAAVLKRLWNFPELRPHVPRLLHAGDWNESYVLFQTALQGEKGPTSFAGIHKDFLQALWNVHRVERSGQSLVGEVGAKWEKAVPFLGDKWEELGREVLRRSSEDLDRLTVRCGITHGDFAPWNTRVQQEKLLLFDWESADWESPTSWDIFHFDLQTAAHLKKNIGRGRPSDHELSRGAPYLLYLLSSSIQFLQEENWSAIEHRRRLLLGELERTLYVRADAPARKRRAVRSTVEEAGFRSLTSVSRLGHNATVVTTSWDDGDPSDVKIAEMLGSRGLPGTFYVPMLGYLGRTTLPPGDLRAISAEGFEIGAHSVSHKSLTLLAGEPLKREVTVCKQMLEQLIGREVSMFCYPNGRYNSAVVREVRCAGFRGARTTRMLAHGLRFGPFEMPTTLHAYPHPKSAYLRNLARAQNVGRICEYIGRLSRIDSWIALGKKLFDLVVEEGGVWHLYGHSWEIEELGIWPDLHEMLDYVSNREGVTYVTNAQLVQLMKPAPGISLARETERNIAEV